MAWAQQLLASAGLPQDQHSAAGPGNLFGPFENGFERVAAAQQIFVGRLQAYLFPQVGIFRLETILESFNLVESPVQFLLRIFAHQGIGKNHTNKPEPPDQYFRPLAFRPQGRKSNDA